MVARVLVGMVYVFGGVGVAAGQGLFANEDLQAAVEGTLWVSEPTPADMLGLTSLFAGFYGIDDLSGLEYAVNLQELNLPHNAVSDLTPLQALTGLQSLLLNTNDISDLSPLSELTDLRLLDMHDNDIYDVGPLAALTALESVTLHNNQISDISSFSGLVEMRVLQLDGNQIVSLTPLAGMTELQTLSVSINQIDDISALAGMTNLEYLNLYCNQISDISALAGMEHLERVNLSCNQISDISALTSLTSLTYVDLRGNPLGPDAYGTYLPQIAANNPGVTLSYNPLGEFQVAISSTVGGTVVSPGEGSFCYGEGDTVAIEAAADEGYEFIAWSGTFSSEQNPVTLKIDRDYTIEAVFAPMNRTYYVDDDAPADPASGDPTVSDPQEDGTVAHPFDSIQEAIKSAADGDTIVVRSGTYRQKIDLLGKAIRLTGLDPNGGPLPIIDGNDTGPVVSFVSRENANCIVSGFVITSGRGKEAAAVSCAHSSPVLTNCLIVGNVATGSSGAAVYCVDSNALFDNCTIADNIGGIEGGGIMLIDSRVIVTNSIVWSNSPNQLSCGSVSKPVVTYTDIEGGWSDAGNIDLDPLFIRPGSWAASDDGETLWQSGDYHPMSSTGRWEEQTQTWLTDTTTSPCIDGGDPAAPIRNEPAPNGGLVNMGAYGGTAHAGKADTP